MPWQTMDVEEQKVRFVVAATRQEKSFSALCQEFGISRPTGCLSRKRYQEAGLAGIAEHSRRPRQSPTRTTAELEQRVVQMRQRYPDWGARKLQVLLAREKVELTRSTIHRVLLRHDLVRDHDRHSQATSRFERGAPNELWQMDFKSPKGWNAAVGPLSVLDDHSRYLLVLQAVWSAHGELVREQLESAFARAAGDADGSRHPVVEGAGADGRDAIDGMADEAGHPSALERVSPSPDARQSRTFSRRPRTGAAGAGRAAKRTAALARCLSLGAQPCASARSLGHANSGQRVAQE